MSHIELGYKPASGIRYGGRIQKIAPGQKKLRPIYEAFINAFEAIKDLSKGNIVISIQYNNTLSPNNDDFLEFDNITIKDNGVGFNDDEFKRFLTLDDTSKGIGNKGTGRIQLIHYFEKAEYESVFADDSSSTKFRKRVFTLSKKDAFLKQNAIVRLDVDEEVSETSSYTILTLSNPLDSTNQKLKKLEYLKTLSTEYLKEEIQNNFLALLCDNRDNLPEITFQRSINGVIDLESKRFITQQDIPTINNLKNIDVYYSKINDDGCVGKSTNKETLTLKCFKIDHNKLVKNFIKLVSKGEIAKDIRLDNLAPDEIVDNNRYLFLISGNIIDDADTDNRGNLHLLTETEFKALYGDANLFSDEVITINEIQETTNTSINNIYPEIAEHAKQKQLEIDALQNMFLLRDETIRRAKIQPADDEKTTLEKIYKADSELVAKKDIEIKRRIDALDKLVPNSSDYQEKLLAEVDALTKEIPLQNRTSLTQYIARRKLVLDLFQKILNHELDKFKNGGRIDEKILHNLIFQQTSDNTENSDLWLIAEEFIHFKGVSEKALEDIKYKDKKIFDKEFNEEDKRYLNSLKEKRLEKRPDILLFPEEGKCLIIELKAPDTNVADYLTQIDSYASLIRNYTRDDLDFTAFYGFLIGENIEDRDVRSRVSRFEHSSHFDYWFRPSEIVHGYNGRASGSIYTEVIKYSTLLKRAQLRNKIFIDKLEK
jgi:hypothetical protein